ncbi:MAG: DUF6788 family protein [Acidimicrobiales bacterium]
MGNGPGGQISKRRLAAQTKIADALATTGFALPGTVLVRRYRCGKATCRCHDDQARLHGPYIQWTRKIDQKTVTRRLTDEQWRRYREWFENAKRLRTLLDELETLSLQIFEEDVP